MLRSSLLLTTLVLLAVPSATTACTKHECDQGQSTCNADGTVSSCDAYAGCGDSGFVCDSVWTPGVSCGAAFSCQQQTEDHATCLPDGAKLTCEANYLPAAQAFAGVVGDFNGDGKLDVVEATADALQVALGKGDATFTAGPTTSTPSGQSSYVNSFAVGDFDGDGNLDVAALRSNALEVYLGDGKGGLGNPIVSASPNVNDVGLVGGDVNGDGKTDLMVDGRAVLLSAGSGRFAGAPGLSSPASINYGASLVDLDGDGHIDWLALTSGAADGGTVVTGVAYAWGHGDGSFDAPTLTPIDAAATPSDVAAADFDGDGLVDIAVADAGNILLLAGKANRAFGSPTTAGKTVLSQQAQMLAGDVDGDGRPDLVLMAQSAGALLTYQTAGFSPPFYFAPAHEAASLASLADFDNDGRADALVIVDDNGGRPDGLRVLPGTCK